MEARRDIATILQDWYYIGNKRVNGKVIGIRGYSIVNGNMRQCSLRVTMDSGYVKQATGHQIVNTSMQGGNGKKCAREGHARERSMTEVTCKEGHMMDRAAE